jgi:GAF domain-containing protein
MQPLQFLKRIYRLDFYSDALAFRQAIAIYSVSTAILVCLLTAFLVYLALFLTNLLVPINSFIFLIGAVLGFAAFLSLLLVRNNQRTTGAILLLVTWYSAFGLLMLLKVLAFAIGFCLLVFGLSLTALILRAQVVIVSAMVSIAVIIATLSTPDYALLSISGNSDRARISLMVGAVCIVILFAMAFYFMARNLRGVNQNRIELEMRNARIANASSNLFQAMMNARMNLANLQKEIVAFLPTLVADTSSVQIYLIDRERRNAVLTATNSDPTRIGQQVGVGSLNVVGRATISSKTITVRDTAEEQAYRRAAFVEGTKAQAIVPIRLGQEVIGALDLQSKNVKAFTQAEIDLLEPLASQIAIALDNARLYAEAQDKTTELGHLYEQAKTSLFNIEKENQELTGGVWANYLRSMTNVPAITIEPGTGRVEDDADWSNAMADASAQNQVVVRSNNQLKTLSLPISVRGQVIGVMEFELPPNQNVPADQINILKQVVERLGLAVENIRLLEEAQRLAQREAMINEITTRMQIATSVDAVVAAAAQSLADAFESPRVAIRVGTPNKTIGSSS